MLTRTLFVSYESRITFIKLIKYNIRKWNEMKFMLLIINKKKDVNDMLHFWMIKSLITTTGSVSDVINE